MKKVFSLIGIVIGIAIIIFGIRLASINIYGYSGSYTSSYTFGADYYTEQYAATRNTANNLDNFAEYAERVVEKTMPCIGVIVALFGAAVSCFFGCRFADSFKGKAAKAPVQQNDSLKIDISDTPPASEPVVSAPQDTQTPNEAEKSSEPQQGDA